MTSKPDYYVIQYRIADGPWQHGRSIEPWVFEDKAVLRDQRQYTVEAAREAEGGVAERITTRVLSGEEGWNRLDEQRAQRQPTVADDDDEPDFTVEAPADRPIPAVLGETEWGQIVQALQTQYNGAAHRLADRIAADVLTR